MLIFNNIFLSTPCLEISIDQILSTAWSAGYTLPPARSKTCFTGNTEFTNFTISTIYSLLLANYFNHVQVLQTTHYEVVLFSCSSCSTKENSLRNGSISSTIELVAVAMQ